MLARDKARPLGEPQSRVADRRLSLPEVHGSVRVGGSWLRRLLGFSGPGYLVAVGYMDPGNWATDLAGGARFGYTLLSVILLSNFMAILLQALLCAPGPRHRARPRPDMPRGLSESGRLLLVGHGRAHDHRGPTSPR